MQQLGRKLRGGNVRLCLTSRHSGLSLRAVRNDEVPVDCAIPERVIAPMHFEPMYFEPMYFGPIYLRPMYLRPMYFVGPINVWVP